MEEYKLIMSENFRFYWFDFKTTLDITRTDIDVMLLKSKQSSAEDTF